MKEVKLKSNESDIKIFINGLPDLSLMPKDELELIIVGIELKMTEYFKHKRKKCQIKV